MLGRAHQLGFFGPGPLSRQLDHARAMATATAAALGTVPDAFADLGSGGGVPGLVLLEMWPAASAVLIEVAQKRSRFLAEALDRLGWSARAQVVEQRAEAVGRDDRYRGRFGLVTARSFGPPAVTAECAAPLLVTGGCLVVSEPPAGQAPPGRWPASGLAELGMRTIEPASPPGVFSFKVIEQGEPCPDRFPRRTGVPARRPLF